MRYFELSNKAMINRLNNGFIPFHVPLQSQELMDKTLLRGNFKFVYLYADSKKFK